MKIGDKLKKAREQCGMSQSEVAETLHLARQTVSKWETDKSTPDLVNLAALSQLYQISLDELLGSEKGESAAECMEKELEVEKAEVDWKEQGVLFGVALVSGLFPILGIIVPIVILWKYRKEKIGVLLKILLVICIFVGVYNCFWTLNSWFHFFVQTDVSVIG